MPDPAYFAESPTAAAARLDLRFRSRRDILRTAHKELRQEGALLLIRLGSVDWLADSDAGGAIGGLRRVGETVSRHLQAVEGVVHPLLEARVPGMTQEPMRRHGRLRARLKDLSVRAAQVERAEGAGQRGGAGHRLYLAYSAFVAELLDFLNEEEATTLSVLQQLFSDTELAAMEAAMAQDDGAETAAA